MGRFSRPYTGYRRTFTNMDDIYREYKQTLMSKGPYKAYFDSKTSYGEPRKFSKTQYSREPLSSTNSGERERKEQKNEPMPVKTDETKTEISKEDSQKIETPKETESSQKIETKPEMETSQKIEQELETDEELLQKKLGLSELYQNSERQTDIKDRIRPSPYYDKSEVRW